MNNSYRESVFNDHESDRDYENVSSNSVIASMYSALSISSCPMGGRAMPIIDDEQF